MLLSCMVCQSRLYLTGILVLLRISGGLCGRFWGHVCICHLPFTLSLMGRQRGTTARLSSVSGLLVTGVHARGLMHWGLLSLH